VDRLYGLSDHLAWVADRCAAADLLAALGKRYPGVRVESPPPQAARAPVNQRLLETILSNLLDNALASETKTPPSLRIEMEPAGLVFTVQDEGRGIPKHSQAGLFKPFFLARAGSSGSQGVGLGLYIVRELAGRLSGTVELDSEEGKGTRVQVRIPTAK